MGLLDDAIREHLDLKRARGADPAEIQRLEREALGPVRREPTIGSARFEMLDEHAPVALDPEYPDEHLTDLEELQDLGYHDSTAPHPHPQHGHVEAHHELTEPHLGHDDRFDSVTDEPEQPRRRFLRRNRPSSLSQPIPIEPGFHEEEPVEPHDLFDPLAPHDAPEREEQLELDEPLARPEPRQHEEAPGEPPPHLQFEHPPKRPRFTAEPPSPQPPGGEAPPTAAERAPRGEPEEEPAAQETTEFDVERHIAETRHLPDEDAAADPPVRAGEDATEGEDEDVLEETPEFLQDTPEHDRLWFEQRPPRDFDFDG